MSIPAINRAWTLASRPEGRVSTDNFFLRTDPLERSDLKPGDIRVRNRLFAVAPTIRNWLNPTGNVGRGSISLGGVIMGMAGSEVLDSRHPDFEPGDRIVAFSRWEDVSILTPDRAAVPVFPVPAEMTFEDAMGALSPNTLTAYFGLTQIGAAKAGETVVVSAAAGSVGSVVCQIARILGCRVVAIAGGPDKCAWLRDVCRVDATIDYKAEPVADRLKALCPGGVNVYFDNVGGQILQAAVDTMAVRGRIVLCGQISAYDTGKPAPGPRDMMRLVYGQIRMEGFVVGAFIDQVEEARVQLRDWLDSGELIVRTDVRQGLETLPAAFADLFSGANRGTLLVRA